MSRPRRTDLPAGVTEHRDARGRVRFHARLVVDGQRRSLGLYETPEEAGAVYAAAIEARGGGRGLTLRAWGETWLERRETDGVHRAGAKDASRWRSHVLASHMADMPLRRIARTDVVRWVRELVHTEATSTATTRPVRGERTTTRTGLGRRLATQTIRNALGLLRRALGDAADEGHVQSNVAMGVTVPRRPREDEPWAYLTLAEIDAVLELELRPEQRAIYTVAIYTGLRAGELWGLRWDCVILDGERPELVVRRSYDGPTKGGRVRRVPLLRQAREALAAWRRERPGLGPTLVWPADDGGTHAEGFDAGWVVARRDAGITRRVRFHDLRHTAASHLVMGSWGPAWRLEHVREMLGHRSITTTERYAHLAPDGLHAQRAATDEATPAAPGKVRRIKR